jgi:hypothetical protein
MAFSVFNIYIKISSNNCKKINKSSIYIRCTELPANKYKYELVKKTKASDGSDSITPLLIYEDYFGNEPYNKRYTDDAAGKALLKKIMSYTLYTKYFNFINFIHYINSNYYIRDWKANSILKIIFEGMKNKNEIPIVTTNKQNIFFVLAELLTTVENVKKVNEQYYDVYSSYPPDDLEKKQELIFKGDNNVSAFRAEKEPFLQAWNIHPKQSQPFSTKGLEAGILNVIDFINNCTHRYSILYTFIGDIQTVLNNFRNIVDIIITTITEIQEGNNTRDNLNTWVEIFYLYKSYITSESFITELDKLKEIINGDIAMLNHIIIEAWNTCHVKENFHKLDIEQAMEAENEKIETLKTKGKKSKISKKTPATSLADESKPKLIDDATKRAESTVDTIKKDDDFAIETVKYYFFKYSVLVTDKLDEADKIYKKWDYLIFLKEKNRRTETMIALFYKLFII